MNKIIIALLGFALGLTAYSALDYSEADHITPFVTVPYGDCVEKRTIYTAQESRGFTIVHDDYNGSDPCVGVYTLVANADIPAPDNAGAPPDLSAIQAIVNDHESRIQALEAATP